MDMQHLRAYALIETKALDENARIFSGIATSPEVDRVGDTINMDGVRFATEIPLLHQHRHDTPIGTARFGKATKKGIPFVASIPVIDEPPTLKERVDVAWGEIKHKLVRGVSLGFRAVKYAFRDDGGIDFQEIEVYELSAVTIPANSLATIQSVKALAGARAPRPDGSVLLVTHAAPAPAPRDLKGAVQLLRR